LSETITRERLEQIKNNWLGADRKSGLAVVGNENYRQVAELIAAVEKLMPKAK
jgi:hypothetical protein